MKMPEVQPPALQQEQIDATTTLALAQASVAAYTDYENSLGGPPVPVVPPDNFKTAARWTGWDGFALGFGEEERYGLVFQSVLPGGEGTFIFAFRGTDSDLDIWNDLFADTTAFTPQNGGVAPIPYVASGFYSIYNDVGGTMTSSMRQQLFALLNKFKPKKLYVTGHSLGAALSQLFTLDVAISAPQIWTANMNFASPRVGTGDWQTAYEQQPAQQDPSRKTVRVYNYWDYAPSVPPSDILGYVHVGRGFITSFYVNGVWLPYLDARHSILNLQVVLRNAVPLNPQVWIGSFTDRTGSGYRMISAVPPRTDVRWTDKLVELDQFQQSILDGSQAPAP